MNVLFLFVSLPHLKDKSGLYSSLIHEFSRHGHNVLVSTKAHNKNTHVQEEEKIKVLRISSFDFTGVSSNIKKAIAYQIFAIKQKFYINKYWGKERVDLIVTHSLPPELALIVAPLKKNYKCPLYLIQSDYTWQDAVGLGYFTEKSLVARYYKFWEKKILNLADFIGCPTKGNIGFIKKYYPKINDNKFDILPFWMNELYVEPNFELRKKFGLEDRFVVIYGGSVGAAQKIEHLVELADACKSYKNISFVILGDGAKLKAIEKMILEKGLENVMFKDFLPQEQYLSFLATCDVGLIILNESLGTPNFPSKALSYMNMKVPILAALDYVTDFGTYLEENNAGLWAYSNRTEELKEKLLMYYFDKNLRDSIRTNGYNLFKQHLTTKEAYNTIIRKVNKNLK